MREGWMLETERLIITEFTPGVSGGVRAESLDGANRRLVRDEVFETGEIGAGVIAGL